MDLVRSHWHEKQTIHGFWSNVPFFPRWRNLLNQKHGGNFEEFLTQKWGSIGDFSTRWDPKKPVKKVGWNNSTYRGYIYVYRTPGKTHQAIYRGEITSQSQPTQTLGTFRFMLTFRSILEWTKKDSNVCQGHRMRLECGKTFSFCKYQNEKWYLIIFVISIYLGGCLEDIPPKHHHCKNTKIPTKVEGGDDCFASYKSPLRISSFAPANWWLEDEFSFWEGLVSGAILVPGSVGAVSFRCNELLALTFVRGWSFSGAWEFVWISLGSIGGGW